MAELFQSKKKWILDGGLGSELKKRGHNLDHPLWSAHVLAKNPKEIFEIHKSYLAAGADVILTSSYQASVKGFVRHLDMYPREAQEVVFFTVELACRARAEYLESLKLENKKPRDILIGASIGPYGATLANGSEYTGDYAVGSPEVGDYYAQKIEHLILPRGKGEKKIAADFLAFETVPTKKEAELIEMILKTIPWAKAWISFSRMEALREALPKLDRNPQIVAVGLNCIAAVEALKWLPEITRLTNKPIVIYPNGRAPGLSFAQVAPQLFEMGATIVGGCCGVGPHDIQLLAAHFET